MSGFGEPWCCHLVSPFAGYLSLVELGWGNSSFLCDPQVGRPLGLPAWDGLLCKCKVCSWTSHCVWGSALGEQGVFLDKLLCPGISPGRARPCPDLEGLQSIKNIENIVMGRRSGSVH